MRRLIPILFGTFVLAQNPTALTPIAVVKFPALDEMSGLAASNRYKGVYWTHNDSGDSARIFAIRQDGSVVMPPGQTDATYKGIAIEGAGAIDWEDIAIDGGTIYIADVGNNGNVRRDLTVYAIKEPNPNEDQKAKPTKVIPVRYPDQFEFPGSDWRFDCESIVVYKKRLYFLTKHRGSESPHDPMDSTALYRLDTKDTQGYTVLTKLGEAKALGGWVTAADVSPNGKLLAVLAQFPKQAVHIYEIPKNSEKMLAGKHTVVPFAGGKQCEGICFVGNDTVMINNEQRDLFLLKVR